MKSQRIERKITSLSLALLAITSPVWAADTETTSSATPTTESTPQILKTLTFQASPDNQNQDISAVAKTVVTREEMLQYGDQSVSDALRRAAGFQLPAPGQGPRANSAASGMRFRGGGGPTFLINGEPVQGGPRGGMSVVDSITTDMIERIEIVKQPSVAQASVASSAVVNIILKEPLDALINGNVRIGYGEVDSGQEQEMRKQLSVQTDGRQNAWSYSLSANQMWLDTTAISQTIDHTGKSTVQKRVTDRVMQMLAPRVEYSLDDEQKLVAELFYRDMQSQGHRNGQLQDDDNSSIRLNTRYERNADHASDKVRLSTERQTETQLTRSLDRSVYTDETIHEYGLAYDGLRKLDDDKQIKFGTDVRSNELKSNVAETLDERRYALYSEGSWRFTPQQTLTLGARQEWIQRRGLVDYDDQHFSPVLAHRFEFTDAWSLQTNLSRAFQSPQSSRLAPTVSISTDSDAGSLNNPDRGGNPALKPEKITALETTLGYNTASGGMNMTAFHRDIQDYIENVIALEGDRYVQRPQNQSKATAYGVEISGRYAIKQTSAGHALMLNGQLSSIRAKIDNDTTGERLASDVAPYTASTGLSYSYQPWQLSTSFTLNYTPKFTRALNDQPYERTTNQRVNLDLSVSKKFGQGWGTTLTARNILAKDYKEFLTQKSDGTLYESRVNSSIPSVWLTLEKKF